MSENPFIEVCIPYEVCMNVGESYNRTMEKAKDWVLFLDHDVYVCNPDWYDICLSVIKRVGHQAGVITAVCNRSANGDQHDRGAPTTNNLADHYERAKQLYEIHDLSYNEVTNPDLTGFFILTHKQAWYDVGKFNTDRFHVDGRYCLRIHEKNYKSIVIPGLYFYHLETAKNKFWYSENYVEYGHGYIYLHEREKKKKK
jgi:GT2 family glycosyltransferase